MIKLYHHPLDDLTSLQQVLAMFLPNLTRHAQTTEATLVADERLTPGHCLAVIDGEGRLNP